MRTTLFVLGRMIFGGFFAYNGLNHFRRREMMSGYAASKGVPPEVAGAAVLSSGGLILAAGISVAAGIRPREGLAAIVGFLLPVSLQMHRFWETDEPQQRASEMTQFMKNMALAGAALAMLQIPEPWPMSVASGNGPSRGPWPRAVSYPRFTERTLRALPA